MEGKHCEVESGGRLLHGYVSGSRTAADKLHEEKLLGGFLLVSSTSPPPRSSLNNRQQPFSLSHLNRPFCHLLAPIHLADTRTHLASSLSLSHAALATLAARCAELTAWTIANPSLIPSSYSHRPRPSRALPASSLLSLCVHSLVDVLRL